MLLGFCCFFLSDGSHKHNSIVMMTLNLAHCPLPPYLSAFIPQSHPSQHRLEKVSMATVTLPPNVRPSLSLTGRVMKISQSGVSGLVEQGCPVQEGKLTGKQGYLEVKKAHKHWSSRKALCQSSSLNRLSQLFISSYVTRKVSEELSSQGIWVYLVSGVYS